MKVTFFNGTTTTTVTTAPQIISAPLDRSLVEAIVGDAIADLPIGEYDDTEVKQRLSTVETAVAEIPAPYDDTSLAQRMQTVENQVGALPPPYDDAALKSRVASLEQAPPTHKHQASEIEGLPAPTPPYDDAEIRSRLDAIESAPAPVVPVGFYTVGTTLYLDLSDGTSLQTEIGVPNDPPDVAPSVTIQPTLSGTGASGSTLTLDPGAASGNPTPTRAIQWYRGATAIGGATGTTYTLTDTDAERSITARVTWANAAGTVTATTNAINVAALPAAPTITTQATISGTGALGSTLTVSTGAAIGNPAPTAAIQWLRNGSTISGATSASYTVASADQGTTLTARVTWSNGVSPNAVSSPTIAIAAAAVAPTVTTAPTISGSTAEGTVLTSTLGAASGNPAPTSARQWLANGVAVAGATGATFDTTGRGGQAISLRVTWTNSAGSVSATSNVINVVAAGPALLYSYDWEDGVPADVSFDTASSAVVTSPTLGGTRAARVTGGTAGWGFTFWLDAPTTEIHIRQKVRLDVTTNPASTFWAKLLQLGRSGSWDFVLNHVLRADGTSALNVWNTAAGAATATSANIARGQVIDLEMRVLVAATNGRIVVRVNGSTVIDYTGNTGTAAVDRIQHLAQDTDVRGAAFQHLFDDHIAAQTAWPQYSGGGGATPGTGTVTATGNLSNIRLQGETGTLTVPTASVFSTTGDAPTYSLVSPPSGVTINSSTGLISIPSTTRRRNAPVTVRASVGTSSADRSFNLTVGPRIGIACPKNEIFGNTASELTFIFNRFRDMGISEFRMDMIWMDVQPTNSAVNWSASEPVKYINVANAAAAAGIDLIFCVHMTPGWARLSGANYNGPGNPTAFGNFCADVATQFTSGGRRLIGLEIWNEPNLTGPNTFWQYGRPASELAAMQIAAHQAVKAVRPDMPVGMGGLSAVPATGGSSSFYYIAATEWITALYAAGFRNYNDFFAIHPYTYPFPWDDGVTNDDGLEVTLACRAVAANNGDGAKEWWFTEYGAPTNPPVNASRARTEAQQAQMFRDIFDWAGANPWMKKLHWYSYYDRVQSGSTDTEDGFGIFRYDEMTAKQIVADIQAVRKGS